MISSSQSNSLPSTPEASQRTAEFLVGVVRSLVDQPDLVVVDTGQSDTGIAFRVFVSPDDLGKVIGKQGRTARSLRTILSAIGSRNGQRYSLDVLEIEA